MYVRELVRPKCITYEISSRKNTHRHDWIKDDDPSGNMQVAAYLYIQIGYTEDQEFFSKQ